MDSSAEVELELLNIVLNLQILVNRKRLPRVQLKITTKTGLSLTYWRLPSSISSPNAVIYLKISVILNQTVLKYFFNVKICSVAVHRVHRLTIKRNTHRLCNYYCTLVIIYNPASFPSDFIIILTFSSNLFSCFEKYQDNSR